MLLAVLVCLATLGIPIASLRALVPPTATTGPILYQERFLVGVSATVRISGPARRVRRVL